MLVCSCAYTPFSLKNFFPVQLSFSLTARHGDFPKKEPAALSHPTPRHQCLMSPRLLRQFSTTNPSIPTLEDLRGSNQAPVGTEVLFTPHWDPSLPKRLSLLSSRSRRPSPSLTFSRSIGFTSSRCTTSTALLFREKIWFFVISKPASLNWTSSARLGTSLTISGSGLERGMSCGTCSTGTTKEVLLPRCQIGRSAIRCFTLEFPWTGFGRERGRTDEENGRKEEAGMTLSRCRC